MASKRSLLLMLALLLIPLATPAQDPKQKLNDQLFEAVRKGDVAAVTGLLDKGADLNAKFRYGATALFKAAERGHAEVVKLLLARGADVSVKDTFYNTTAMSWALDNKITTPTPFVAHDLIFVTSGYAPIQPIYAIRPGANGDISLKDDKESNEFIAWSKKRGGPYMPTPIVYGDLLYTCSNQGVLAAYKVDTGERVYQERLAGKGGAFTASPVASDGKIYLSSEDGDVFVVKAG